MVHPIANTFITGLFALALPAPAAAEEGCARIGVVAEFRRASGSPSQPFGDEIRRGVELAKLRFGRGPACVEYELIDIANSVSNVGGAIERAARRGLRVFVGLGVSDQALAAVPALYRTGSILITPTSSVTSLARFDRVLSLYPSNEKIADRIADEMKRRGLGRPAVVFASNDSYGRDMRRAFGDAILRRGGRVLAVPVRAGRFDSDSVAAQILDGNPDGIFVPMFEVDAAKIIASIMRRRNEIWFVGSDAWSTNAHALLKLLGRLRPNALVPIIYDHHARTPVNDWFKGRYVARYHRRPSDLAAFSFDGVSLARAILTACPSRDVVPSECLKRAASVRGTMAKLSPAQRRFAPAISVRAFAGGQSIVAR